MAKGYGLTLEVFKAGGWFTSLVSEYDRMQDEQAAELEEAKSSFEANVHVDPELQAILLAHHRAKKAKLADNASTTTDS